MSLEHRPLPARLARRRRRGSCRQHPHHQPGATSTPSQPVLHSGEAAHVQRRPKSRHRPWLKQVQDATSQECTLARLRCFRNMCECKEPAAMASGGRRLLALVAELSCLVWPPPSSPLTFLVTLSSPGGLKGICTSAHGCLAHRHAHVPARVRLSESCIVAIVFRLAEFSLSIAQLASRSSQLRVHCRIVLPRRGSRVFIPGSRVSVNWGGC